MTLLNNILGVTCDSREVKPGYAFVAIQGLKKDGHDFIQDALRRGASFIITEKPVTLNTKIPIQQVQDGRIALAEIAAAISGHPSKSLRTIGVTGTNGKTTSTFLIHHLFNTNQVGCGLIGTVDIDTGLEKHKALLTTPDAVQLQNYLKEMVKAGLQVVSMEVSSHGIELKRTYGINFDLAIFTNITRDHFDFHNDFENYVRIKKVFFEQLSERGIALINGDDSHASFITKNLAAQVITYGIEKDTTISAENITHENLTTYYDLVIHQPIQTRFVRIQPIRVPIKIKLAGRHNIYNTLAACSAGLLLGLKAEQIQKISEFSGIWRRFQIIYDNEYTIIDDCAHNPGSYSAVFQALEHLTYKNLYIINAIRGNRGVQINQDNARTIASWVKQLSNVKLLVTNCADLVKNDDIVAPKEEEIFLNTLQAQGLKYEHHSTLQSCFDIILQTVQSDDLVLLLGAHAMDQAGELILKRCANS